MSIKIDIEKYLSEEEIQEQCKSALFSKLKSDDTDILIRKQIELFLSKHVNKILIENKDELKKQVLAAIDGLCTYRVFEPVQGREARKILTDTVLENKAAIHVKIKSLIESNDTYTIKDHIEQCVYDYVSDTLFKKEESK